MRRELRADRRARIRAAARLYRPRLDARAILPWMRRCRSSSTPSRCTATHQRSIAGLPADRIRLHLCWGNYDGPHTHDVPLEPLCPSCTARTSARCRCRSQPRHQHESRPSAVIRCGVHAVRRGRHRFHDERRRASGGVADRIVAAADVIGDRTRVLAGVDCGFGTFAGSQSWKDSIVWDEAPHPLREGAELATRRLWR